MAATPNVFTCARDLLPHLQEQASEIINKSKSEKYMETRKNSANWTTARILISTEIRARFVKWLSLKSSLPKKELTTQNSQIQPDIIMPLMLRVVSLCK